MSCAPVPNACAGVDRDVEQAGAAAAGSAHGGRTCSRSPIVTGWWKLRQRSAQSSATSVVVMSTSAVAGRRAQRRQRGQLARRAVDRVLDVVAAVDLLDARRRELEQLGEHDLGVRARDAHARA